MLTKTIWQKRENENCSKSPEEEEEITSFQPHQAD